MYPGHRGGYGHPPGAKTPGITYPSVHTSNPALDGTEGSRALVREAPLHALHCARGGGSPVPYPTCSDSAGIRPGMNFASLSLQDL